MRKATRPPGEGTLHPTPSKFQPDSKISPYGDDWNIYSGFEKATLGELRARFYYEFARESEIILRLVDEFVADLARITCEKMKEEQTKVLRSLNALHPSLVVIVCALSDSIDLRGTGWMALKDEQRHRLIKEFNPVEVAFREVSPDEWMRYREGSIKRDKEDKFSTKFSPDWQDGSLFYYTGLEFSLIRIDWSQGPQAIERLMAEWYRGKKKAVRALAERGILPGDTKTWQNHFVTKDVSNAGHPKIQLSTALKGLAATRLLSTRNLWTSCRVSSEANGKPVYGKTPKSGVPIPKISWRRGIAYAERAFGETFYSCNKASCFFRAQCGLPDSERPISFKNINI